MGLYSDLDDFIKKGGRQEPNKEEVENEGNIPDGKPEGRPASGQEIESKDQKPDSPKRSGNIKPSEKETGETDRSSIPISENAPEPPQHTGNIEPTDFDPKKDGSRIQPNEENQPETPRTKNNIRPDEQNRPDNPNKINLEPKGENKPKNPNQSPSDPNDENAPEEPNRRIIDLKEAAEPEDPKTSGNITSEESKPRKPSRRGNISPTEEPSSDGPMEESDFSVEARPKNVESDEKIESEDRRPGPPSVDQNIQPTDEDKQPIEPNRDKNIGSEEKKKEPPQRSGNIEGKEDAEPSPLEDRIERIEPLGQRPQSPNRSGNIPDQKEEDPQPTRPDLTENIPDKTEQDPRPSDPNRSGNIPKKTEEDPRPPTPNRDENIPDKTEQDPRPPSVEKSGNIPEKTEEDPKPPAPNTSGNIPDQKEDDPRPSDPKRKGNIPEKAEQDPEPPTPKRQRGEPDSEDRRPLPPNVEQNINPTDKQNTDGVGGEVPEQPQPFRQTDIDRDPESPKQNRYQPVGLEASPYSGTEYTETSEDGIFVHDTGVPQWETPIRYQPPRFEGQIDDQSEKYRKGIGELFTGEGDDVPEWEVPLRHQPDRFLNQINPEDTEFVDVVAGTDDGVPEWEAPLKYQPFRFSDQIDPTAEETRDGIGPVFPGEFDGLEEWEVVPLRHNPQWPHEIDPANEGGLYLPSKFVAGSDEPGDDIRDMGYNADSSDAELRHQIAVKKALDEGIIDPSYEGGFYLSSKFVTGSDEPGEELRDMKYDVGGANMKLRHQKAVRRALENGVIDPSFEGGVYLNKNFVAGSNEPGDNVRDMKYDSGGVSEDARHAKKFYKLALNNYIIDPSFEGGIYLSPKYVAGSNEPGDNIRNMGYDAGGATEDARHSKKFYRLALDNYIIDPSFEGGKYLSPNFVAGSNEPGDQLQDQPFRQTDVDQDPNDPKQNQHQPIGLEASPYLGQGYTDTDTSGIFPFGAGDDLSEWEVPLRHQPERYANQINPDSVEFANGPRPPEDFNTASRSRSFEDQNEVIRLREFNNKFKDGRTDLPLGDSPIPRSGLSVPNVGTEEPFILRRPEAGGGSSAIANVKQADSRTAPVGSAAEDTVRMSKFFASGKGLTYNIKQQFLQSQNPRKRTRIYDPTAPIQTSASGVATRPGQQITRHLGADSGPAGIVGDVAEGIGAATGFDVPQSSRYEDEIEEKAIDTEWGEMSGSLFWLSPVATEALPEVTGFGARSEIENIRADNTENIDPLFSTDEQSGLSKFASAIGFGGIGNGYLFTNTYDPQGGPQSEGRELTDNYHPSAPYIRNVGRTGTRLNPDSLSYFAPTFNQTYTQLKDKTENERSDQGSFFPYANPDGSPSQENVENGDGEVLAQVQNDSNSDVYFENRAFENRLPLHRGVPGREKSRGLPNYSIENENGDKTKRIDWINRLEPIIGEDADPDTESYGGDGRHEDLIPFQFYDIENEALLVFRAFLEGVSDNLSPEWSQQDYAGRPEKGHTYGGYSNTISFSFQAVPSSEEEFKAIWKKVNYLKGLTTPSGYSSPSGGTGSYMTPPFMRLTIGDMFNDVYGYMNSLTISVNDDMPYELDKDLGRLPQGLEVDIDWQVIKKRAPLAGQKFYDAPFLDEIENVPRESVESQSEVELPTADPAASDDSVDDRRAFELTNESP